MRWKSRLLALTFCGATIAQAAPPAARPEAEPPQPALAVLAGEADDNRWPMSLPDAIRIALDNSEIARVVAFPAPDAATAVPDRRDASLLVCWPRLGSPAGSGFIPDGSVPVAGPIVVERLNVGTPHWRFRPEIMAMVRSVEQQYWVVAAQRSRVASIAQLVKTERDIYEKEQNEPVVGRGTSVDLVEAAQCLERSTADLKTQTARLVDAERGLRQILGLPPIDGRHIVPTTRPIDQPVPCDWQQSKAEFLRTQVDLIDEVVVKALSDATAAVNPAAHSGMSLPTPSGTLAMAQQQATREAKEWSESIRRQFRPLETSCANVDAGYHRYQEARKQRAEAARRLEAQRTYYNEGRITITRYFDALSRHAAAVTAEADRAAEYNTAIAALGEAKGTLLADRMIVVRDQRLRMPRNWVETKGKSDEAVAKTSTVRP
jgi:hypothetical protein